MSQSPKSPPRLTLEALQLAFTWGCETSQQSQLVSFHLCNACREAIPLRHTVTDHMPPSLGSMFFGASSCVGDMANAESADNQKGGTAFFPPFFRRPALQRPADRGWRDHPRRGRWKIP